MKTIDYTKLDTAPRLLMEAELQPIQGTRFQPTGFADLGPARYTLPDGTEMLLVESAQSVANRLETTIWDDEGDNLIPGMQGLPYIRVNRSDGTPLTNSILESHRINSEYISASDFYDKLKKEIDWAKDAPVDWKKFRQALLKYDIGALLHGCFLEEIEGRLRVTRAVSGFIEASGVRVVESGGVKNNFVTPSIKGGEGNVIFHRTEFTAEKITAFFNLDLALLRSYGLGKDAAHLMIALALFKIRHFLSNGLRLRTACDLEVAGNIKVTRPDSFIIPGETDLLAECKELIERCRHLFEPVSTVVYDPSKKKKAKQEDAGGNA